MNDILTIKTVLYVKAWRSSKAIRCASTGCWMKFLRACFWAKIVFPHSSIHYGTGTWCGPVDNQGYIVSKSSQWYMWVYSPQNLLWGKRSPQFWKVVWSQTSQPVSKPSLNSILCAGHSGAHTDTLEDGHSHRDHLVTSMWNELKQQDCT